MWYNVPATHHCAMQCNVQFTRTANDFVEIARHGVPLHTWFSSSWWNFTRTHIQCRCASECVCKSWFSKLFSIAFPFEMNWGGGLAVVAAIMYGCEWVCVRVWWWLSKCGENIRIMYTYSHSHLSHSQQWQDDAARKSDYEPLGLKTDKSNNRFTSLALHSCCCVCVCVGTWLGCADLCIWIRIYLKLVYSISGL